MISHSQNINLWTVLVYFTKLLILKTFPVMYS